MESEHSNTLGRGLRCGFLGMLHMEVVQQRLREEHQVDVLVTAPTVPLVATHADGTREVILSPAAQAVETGPLPCLKTAPHLPAWCLLGLGPLLRTPERRLSSLEPRRGLRSPPPTGPKLEDLPLSTSRRRCRARRSRRARRA